MPKPNLTPAEQMLPNPHISESALVQHIHPSTEQSYLALLNTEARLISEGVDQSTLPLGNMAVRLAETARQNTSDHLTGLLNREGLGLWFERYRPEKFAVLFSDARKFKHINDTHGHDVGDEVIKYIGDTIASRFRIGEAEEEFVEKRRKPDTKDAIAGVGRWGGDEIVSIIDATGVADNPVAENGFMDMLKARTDNFGTYKDEKKGLEVPISIRSAAMIGHRKDNRPIKYYQSALDSELSELKGFEKSSGIQPPVES